MKSRKGGAYSGARRPKGAGQRIEAASRLIYASLLMRRYPYNPTNDLYRPPNRLDISGERGPDADRHGMAPNGQPLCLNSVIFVL